MRLYGEVNTMKAILFDFDGVVHDTFSLHRKMISDFSGYELSEQEYRDMHNGNFHGHAVEALKNVDWKAYRDYARKHIEDLVMDDHVRETLRELGEKFDLYIVSSGGETIIARYLEKNGVLDLFTEILGMEFHRSKIEKFQYLFEKYGLNPENSIFVTDTLGDVLEANHLGLRSIAIDSGFHTRETLEKGNPFRIVSDFREITTVIQAYEQRETTEGGCGCDSRAGR